MSDTMILLIIVGVVVFLFGLVIALAEKDRRSYQRFCKEMSDKLTEIRTRAKDAKNIEELEKIGEELGKIKLFERSFENTRRLLLRGFVAGRIYQMNESPK